MTSLMIILTSSNTTLPNDPHHSVKLLWIYQVKEGTKIKELKLFKSPIQTQYLMIDIIDS